LTSSLQLTPQRWLRRLEYGWHYGALPARLSVGAAIFALLVLAWAAWQGIRADRQADHLSARLAQIQSARAASAAATQAAEPPDVVQALPAAPGVAQVMQTLQQAADKEGARVLSLQADDHPPTATALGHLDLVLSIKADYPSILVVIQQVLDRYPGATLRQIQVAHVVSTTPAVAIAASPMPGASAPQATSESEAHVTLAFWRRPLDVESASLAWPPLPATGGAASATTASAPATVASTAAPVRTTAASAASISISTSTPRTKPLPPLAGASGPR
jgi:hypothetical protein